jgi:hypothetical protein
MLTLNTWVLGLITDGIETAYRKEIRDLAVRCHNNNLSVNISKTKELMVDYKTIRHGPLRSSKAFTEHQRTS